MTQETITGITTDNPNYDAGDVSFLIDGDLSEGGACDWLSDGSDFSISMTLASKAIDGMKIKFDGNLPLNVKLYRGNSSGTLLATVTSPPSLVLTLYTFTNTTANTLYTLVVHPDGVNDVGIIEVQLFTGANTSTVASSSLMMVL